MSYLDTSALVRVELLQAAARHSDDAMTAARELIETAIATVALSDDLLDVAGDLRAERGPLPRSLDAIHLASAMRLGPGVDVVSYHQRMTDLARAVGVNVVQP